VGVASFKQQSGLYAVGIVGACGVISPAQLIGLAELAPRMEVAAFKLSTRQTIIAVLPEAKIEPLKEAVTALGLRIGSFGAAVRNVKACAGSPGFCPRMLSDALTLGVELQDAFMDQDVPKDFKIAVAGCHRGCTDPLCADFGAMGNPAKVKGGFDVFIGGRGASRRPLHATQILTSVPPQAVQRALQHVLDKYRELAAPHERLCHTIERLGATPFIPTEEQLGLTEKNAGPQVDDDFLAFTGNK
jgi:dissimilatory sulfite reductase (desulfoviridin) alpha/beta subunit